MLFSSAIFLFGFLPLVLMAYYLSPKQFRNGILLIFSLVFFAWGGVSYSALLIISILLNYFFGLGISSQNAKKSTFWLIVAVIVNIGVLGVFKYANFVVENLNLLFTSIKIPIVNQPNIILPIGISFFTFHSLSYLIDIYRKETLVQKSPIRLALYISLFPQLIAGPIIRYHDVADQLIARKHSIEKFGIGIERFIWGLAKKVIIANNFAWIADKVFALPNDQLSTPLAWAGIIAYSIQIYFDFSGYSDMAIGLAKMFGFDFLENFNFPYIAKSIKDFWRRWHISLSNWFRDYLYIPLGGNRISTKRLYFNLIFVFFVTGLWHGAAWNFIFWGLFHGLFLVLERIGLQKLLDKIWSPFQHVYTLLIVLIGWVFFRADTLPHAFGFLEKMFVDVSNNSSISINIIADNLHFILFPVALIFSTPIISFIIKKLEARSFFNNSIILSFYGVFKIVFYMALLLICVTFLLAKSYNPFIYFRF